MNLQTKLNEAIIQSKLWILVCEEKRISEERNPLTTGNQQIQLTYGVECGMGPWSHWWKASAPATALLLPMKQM